MRKFLIIGVILIVILIVAMRVGRYKDERSNLGRESSQGLNAEKSLTPCPNPLILNTPVDINLATSILYPGQVRGGDYKPHGGFRFDSANNNDIEVKAPMDASLQSASRYIEQGEVQYLFDFMTSCGVSFRFDHLLDLSPKFAEAVEKLPQAKVDDSRTSNVNPEVKVKKGEVIATAVGLRNNKNVFVDFGVYDRKGLNAFKDPRQSALCWFDLLPPEDAARVKSLPPADSVSGSQSDLCKL
ncbi:hypothetical protein HY612_00840 [Candidatus Roizmanbacteria bacterium]|nr:hypothetical protein [Candidatus Roizmanbacteria bacterium]